MFPPRPRPRICSHRTSNISRQGTNPLAFQGPTLIIATHVQAIAEGHLVAHLEKAVSEEFTLFQSDPHAWAQRHSIGADGKWVPPEQREHPSGNATLQMLNARDEVPLPPTPHTMLPIPGACHSADACRE